MTRAHAEASRHTLSREKGSTRGRSLGALRALAWLLVLASLAPFALATSGDVVTNGAAPANAGPDAPQVYCAALLASAHAEARPLLCDASAFVTGATTLRIRIANGAGHAYAYVVKGASQLALLDCRSTMAAPPTTALPAQAPGWRSCSTSLGGSVTGAVELHLVVDGPAGLLVEAQVERTDVPLV